VLDAPQSTRNDAPSKGRGCLTNTVTPERNRHIKTTRLTSQRKSQMVQGKKLGQISD